jgi:hypothetical protein
MKNIKTLLCLVSLLVILLLPLTAKIDCRIEGIVVDQITGKPISGARLTFYDTIWWLVCNPENLVFEAESDEEGYFKVDLLRAFSYAMECHKEGYLNFKFDRRHFSNRTKPPARGRVIEVQEGEIKFLRIEMERSAIVSGRFLKQEGGQLFPLQASGFVYLATNPEDQDFESLGKAIADPEGYLEFSNLMPGRDYLFYMELGNGYPTVVIENIHVVRNKICDISRTYDFTNGGGLEGIISIGGQPPEYFNIEMGTEFKPRYRILTYRYFPRLNDDHYLFRVLEPGKYMLKIFGSSGPGGRQDHYEEIVEIKAREIVKKDFHFKGKQ